MQTKKSWSSWKQESTLLINLDSRGIKIEITNSLEMNKWAPYISRSVSAAEVVQMERLQLWVLVENRDCENKQAFDLELEKEPEK